MKPRSHEGGQPTCAFPHLSIGASSLIRNSGFGIRHSSSAFTLLETLAALLILGLLASAITLSFRAPLNRAKGTQAIEQVRFADTAARAHARKFARPAELTIDFDDNTLSRHDPATGDPISQTQIPAPWRIAELRTAHNSHDTARHTIRFSSSGLTQSYAIKLSGPRDQSRWVLFAGLSPDSTIDLDDEQIQSILAAASPRRHAD